LGAPLAAHKLVRENNYILLSSHPTGQSSKISAAYCALLYHCLRTRETDSYLTQSTDPAHNLSDAFGQKFGKDATKVNGFDNLYAMEIDPTSAIQEMVETCESLLPYHTDVLHSCSSSTADQNGMMGSMMQDLAFAIPGVDEAMGFAEIMK